MPSIRVVTESGEYTFENETVENVAQLVAQAGPALGIGPNANIAVNGAPATPETLLADGDEVTTTKPAGRKG
jgi:molybdopterin converting factor small subunit